MLTRIGAATRRALVLLPFAGGVAVAQSLGGLTQQGTGAGFVIPASPVGTFSSSINISGFTTGIAPTATNQTVAVRLNNFSHSWAGDVSARIEFASVALSQTFTWRLFARPGIFRSQFGVSGDFGGSYSFGEFDGPSNSFTGDLEDAFQFGPTVLTSGDYFAFDALNGTDYGSPGEIFGGLVPNGTWTLFINDAATPDGGALGSWDLAFNVESVTSVPEPSAVALMLAGLAVGAAARRRRRQA